MRSASVAAQRAERMPGAPPSASTSRPESSPSAGIVDGRVLLDLAYEEDHRAEVDLNVVMTGDGRYVEVQGTAEGRPFRGAQLTQLLAVSGDGVRRLTALQHETLAAAGVQLPRRR